jgi:hypothetical protein
MIEIAHDTDPPRIRGPDGEARAVDAVEGAQLRAELFVNPPLVALAEEIQVGLAQRRQKGIGIAGAAGRPGDR